MSNTFKIEAAKIGTVGISLYGAVEDQKRGLPGQVSDSSEVHILFTVHRPSDTPTFHINRVEYRWLSLGIVFCPATGKVTKGNYQQHGESGNLRFRKKCNSANDYPTDSAINTVTKSLDEVISTLSTSPEFKQFALAAIKAKKEEVQDKARELLEEIKLYALKSESNINNVDLADATAKGLLATENIRRTLHKVHFELPRGGQ